MIAQEGQNLYDFCLEKFGTLESLFTLIVDNDLNINTKLVSGQDLIVNNLGVGDQDIKSFVKLQSITFSNDQGTGNPPIESGDFNNDYSNDFG